MKTLKEKHERMTRLRCVFRQPWIALDAVLQTRRLGGEWAR